jgi:hypothetical protein
MPRRRISATACGLLLLACCGARAQTAAWRPVCRDILHSISGMALVEQQDGGATFLVVHDNKHPGQGRLALIHAQPKPAPLAAKSDCVPDYEPLKWRVSKELKDRLAKDRELSDDQKRLADEPFDLEGLAAVPARPNNFMALSSTGWVYLIRLDKREDRAKHSTAYAVEALDLRQLPDGLARGDLEGLALQQFGQKTLIAWAYRGEGTACGVLYANVVDFNDNQIIIPPKIIDKQDICVPWAADETKALQKDAQDLGLDITIDITKFRHVADIKVDAAGVVYAASAVDPRDDGPFRSIVYRAGTFDRDKLTFSKSPKLVPRYPFPGYKVEALELMPGVAGRLVFGTDDENKGSALYLDW